MPPFVAKYRKITGELVEGAKPTDVLFVPAGAIARYPPSTWGDFGSIRTFRCWSDPGKVPPPNVVTSALGVLERSNLGPSPVPGGLGQSSCGSGDPRRRGYSLPRMRDLSEEDHEAANSLCNLRTYSGCSGSERKEGPTGRLRSELLDLCTEGGSQSSSHGSGSSSCEEDPEGDLSGSSCSCSDREDSGSNGASSYPRTSGLRPKGRLPDSQFDLSQGQASEDGASDVDGD